MAEPQTPSQTLSTPSVSDNLNPPILSSTTPQSSPPPQSLPPTSTHKLSLFKKIIFAFITVIILLSIVVAYFFGQHNFLNQYHQPPDLSSTKLSSSITEATPEPKPDDAWLTYTNKEYGFSVHYPPVDVIRADDAPYIVQIHSNQDNGWYHNITFSYHKFENTSNLEDVIKSKYNIQNGYIEPQNIPYDTFSDLRFKIDTFAKVENVPFEAVRFFASVLPDQGAVSGLSLNEAYIKHPNGQGYILMDNNVPTNDGPTPLFDQILSTFQFTRQTTDISNWHTYTDPSNIFSLKYPTSLSSNLGVVSGPYEANSKFIQTISDPLTIAEGTDAPFDGFSIYEQQTNQLKMEKFSFDNYLNNELNDTKQSPMGSPNATLSTINLGNQTFYYIDSQTQIRRYFVLSPDSNTIIVISRINKSQEFLNIFDQILSTLQFTN